MDPHHRLMELNTTECLWIYILRILCDEPTHAYIIRNEINSRFGFRPGIMTAYKVLYLLHKGGYVTKTRSGRKRVYAITEKGKKELSKARSYYHRLSKVLSPKGF